MSGKQDGAHSPPGQSRSNKRIQELEERAAHQAKELRQIHEMLGTKVDTKELLACTGQKVSVKDVTGELSVGVLERVGKWTITVKLEEHSFNSGEDMIFFKSNLIRVTPVGSTDE